MAKRRTRENQTTDLPPITSGAVGGPGTARLAFQVDNAIWHALNMISEASCRALEDLYVTIEPRVISSLGVTGWDIGLQPNDENIEVKFNATRKDVEEWLDRIGKTAAGAPLRRFTLVYNKGGNALINAVEDLRRIAIECQNDDEKFRLLVAGEQIFEAEEVLRRLGSDAHLILQRMKTDHLPESVLQKNTLIITRLLAGVEGDNLYRLLYDKISHGVAGRIKFAIKDLIREAEQNQISLRLPPTRLSSENDPVIAATLFLLQSCVTGLPIDIVAYAVDYDAESLKGAVKTLVQDGKIVEEGNRWFVLPQTNALIHPNGKEILARALDELLRYIKAHDNDDHAFAQIHNAVSLAKECAVFRPRSVIPVFPTLDKPLKRIGDIHFVLEVAQLSINAAQRVESRTRDEAAAFALSLVCGVSWAYQRMPGHLDDARSAYLRSRNIAESIEDKVTLAFISKCLGRLCRMEAEQVDISREVKDSRVRESVQLLHDAIERFEELSDFSRKTHEVADSYSLLARTYLVMRESDKVEQALRNAFSRMENLQSKEYADLLILNGDFEATRRNYSAARLSYDKALELQLETGAVSSEIRARVLRQRGLSFLADGRFPEGKHDLLQAADIWSKLGQLESSAAARWEATRSDQNLPSQIMQLLEKEAPSVRVEFAELHSKRMNERASKRAHLSSREQPSKAYFEDLIKQARQQSAIRNLNE